MNSSLRERLSRATFKPSLPQSEKLTIKNKTLDFLVYHVTGGQPDKANRTTPYRSKASLVSFFTEFEATIQEYLNIDGFLENTNSRTSFTKECINIIISYGKLADFLIYTYDPYKFENTDFSVDEAISEVNKLLSYDNLKLENKGTKSILIIEGKNENQIEIITSFEENEKLVLESIRNAKFSIWVAMAYFTSTTIYKELVLKAKKGLDIRIIVGSDDSIQLDDQLFRVIRVAKFGINQWNTMHNKFSVFDSHFVLNGSYNWTNNASGNKENVSKITAKDTVTVFSVEFNNIWKQFSNDQKENKKAPQS